MKNGKEGKRKIAKREKMKIKKEIKAGKNLLIRIKEGNIILC
jgi:hypothetical protein